MIATILKSLSTTKHNDYISKLVSEFHEEKVERRKSYEVKIGNVAIGGDNSIAIQAMTNTETKNVSQTVEQIVELVNAGAELVRITVNSEEAARSVPIIKDRLINKVGEIPIIGDFHYNGHTLLTQYPDCAIALDKYRINPGNVGFGKLRDSNFETIIELALRYNKPIRIGVNWGSLDKQILQATMDYNGKQKTQLSSQDVLIVAVVVSALRSAKLAEELGLQANHIVLSTKMSDVQSMIKAYKLLANNGKYAIHLGLTEAGMGNQGIVSSTASIGHMLLQGIGDTIRTSITPRLGESRCEEVNICKTILQALGLRQFTPSITSCPGCGRTSSKQFQELTQEIQSYLETRTPDWKQMGLKGYENLHVAVMGCIVNGPGESKYANIGICLPGSDEDPKVPVYINGKFVKVINWENVVLDFKQIIEMYVNNHYKPV